MTRPIHSVKHLKSSYKKFQIITMACAVVTVVLVAVTSISSLQVGRLIKHQKKIRSSEATAIATELNRKLNQSSREVSDLNAKISEMGTTIKTLRAKNADLQKQLSMAKQPPAPVINEETPQGETSPTETNQSNLTPGSVPPRNPDSAPAVPAAVPPTDQSPSSVPEADLPPSTPSTEGTGTPPQSP